MSREVNRFQRTIQNTLSDSKLDRQGRITLTQYQMEIAGIDRDVSIIGRGNNLEIWDTKRFEEYTGSSDDFDEVYYNSIQPRVVRG